MNENVKINSRHQATICSWGVSVVVDWDKDPILNYFIWSMLGNIHELGSYYTDKINDTAILLNQNNNLQNI